MPNRSETVINTKDATRDLRRRVAAKFGRSTPGMMPEHAVLFEVPVDGVRRWTTRQGEPASNPCRRRIDAVAVGLWAKTNHLIHGFELKSTRSDLLAELRDPEKSEPARRLCDRWWLVLSDRALLRDDAPPQGWGVLVVSGRGLRKLADPDPLDNERNSRFVAALVQTALRSHGTCAGLARIDGHLSGYRRGYASGEQKGRITAVLAAGRSVSVVDEPEVDR